MTEREATIEVSFADDGTPSAFERLCYRSIDVLVEVTATETHPILTARCVYYGFGEVAEIESDSHQQPMTTDQSDPIPFHTALELASLHLLARLGGA